LSLDASRPIFPADGRRHATLFINVRDGAGFSEDCEGVDLPDVEAARNEALATGKQLIANHLLSGGRLSEMMKHSLEIADENGTTISTVMYADAAEASGHRP
jgi:hypothetical protein